MTLIERALDLRDATYLTSGLAYYMLCGDTPERAYQSMVRLFCRTRGRSNDLVSRAVSALRPPKSLPCHDGVLGTLTDEHRMAIRDALDRDGFYVFDQLLPASVCDRLLALASSVPSVAQNAAPDGGDTNIVYDRAAPRAVRYELRPDDLLADAAVQELVADWSILTVAQDYLRAAPIFDIVTMWWHTAFRDHPDARAAQFYHFDMDRPRWLKFFFYLTDVGPDNGPHRFIRGSHRTDGIARELLARGYARIDDADVARHYSASEHVCFIGHRGTIIAEDTRGLHKGQHVFRGDRLVFQLELTNTLFGGRLARMRLPTDPATPLRERIQRYPRTYSAFV
ncbi:MAG TPA: phytanoyl-CoA dioxygenase family protein [Kofleriaceae bacterium]|jgi:ectoine hydroxylase-related dioxygenase (phytanoyl-CoA dioxygenase family)|nr:phytanoyl-CoA dioxygenase family protein [Kofleriaceae bacterium]